MELPDWWNELSDGQKYALYEAAVAAREERILEQHRQAERIAELEAENKRMCECIFGLTAQNAEAENRIAELQAELQAIADWQQLVVGPEFESAIPVSSELVRLR